MSEERATYQAGDQSIDWQYFEVTGGQVARNEAGQVAGWLDLAGGLTLNFVFDRTGAKWGWRPDEPAFVPDIVEE